MSIWNKGKKVPSESGPRESVPSKTVPRLLQVNNMQIQLLRKNIKNIYLTVHPPNGEIRLSAPSAMPVDAISRFVATRQEWVLKQQQRIRSSQISTLREYQTGETVFVWGKPYEFVLVEPPDLAPDLFPKAKGNRRRAARIQLLPDQLLMQIDGASTREQREVALNNWYREQLRLMVPPLIEKWQSAMDLSVRDWKIRNTKTRWGSCSIKTKRISLSLQLAKKSQSCLEYVIVHELAHLIVRNHSRDFYLVLTHYLPDWKQIRMELKK